MEELYSKSKLKDKQDVAFRTVMNKTYTLDEENNTLKTSEEKSSLVFFKDKFYYGKIEDKNFVYDSETIKYIASQ